MDLELANGPAAPTVSVVLPAYNREETIRSAVESVLRQTWLDFELLIIDDCSTDRTSEVAGEIDDPRIRILSTFRNMGPSGARNVGIRAARGSWIAFQDSDDEWLPEKLARQMARLAEQDGDWIAAYCGMIIVGDADPTTRQRTRVRYYPDAAVDLLEGHILPSLMERSLISTQMLVAQRDALETLGGFDEELSALVDWELVLRLAAVGPIAFLDEPLVIQRFSDNSITRDSHKRAAARAHIIVKHQAMMKRSPSVLARQYRTLAGEYRRLRDFAAARTAIIECRRLQPRNLYFWVLDFYLRLRLTAGRLFHV